MTKNKVFIFGGGFIGKELLAGINSYLKRGGISTFEPVIIESRIHSMKDAETVLREAAIKYGEPFAIINAMGKKGSPNVDWCEDNKEEVYFANVILPTFLAETAWKNKLAFIHVSTGCIFDGPGPFLPTSVPNFEDSYYSYTKAQVERELIKLQEKFPNVILEMHRIRMPFTGREESSNLITKLIKYGTVVNALNSLTYIPDYTQMTAERLNSIYKVFLDCPQVGVGYTKIINATNPGAIMHKDIINMIEEISGIKLTKTYITSGELNKLCRAPRTNCVLIASVEGIQRPVELALHDAITQYFQKV